MPAYTAHRRKNTWTAKRRGKTVTVRAIKKTWQVTFPAKTIRQHHNERPKAGIHKIEIIDEGKFWRAIAKDGHGNIVKGVFDLDVREVAKVATEWQKRHRLGENEIPITFPKLKKKVSKK